MSFEDKWDQFFKPETRSSGRVYLSKDKISSSQPSDTEVQAFIRGTSPFKITLKCESIDSQFIVADCTCPSSKKGQLCKHIWAALLKTQQSHPDFLEEKTDIAKKQNLPELNENKSSKPTTAHTQSESQIAFQKKLAEKQASYRKEQYQKQKQRLKEQKSAKKEKPTFAQPTFSKEVQASLNFFKANGFILEPPFHMDVLSFAKKRLSRIFHPDIGGTHAEILELNKHFAILTDYIKIQSSAKS